MQARLAVAIVAEFALVAHIVIGGGERGGLTAQRVADMAGEQAALPLERGSRLLKLRATDD